ncbi:MULTISPECIES: hypothetical protein [unclassified Rhizobium]|nr:MULTISPECIES: hypothetical protein [unclassified Rhizobium]
MTIQKFKALLIARKLVQSMADAERVVTLARFYFGDDREYHSA